MITKLRSLTIPSLLALSVLAFHPVPAVAAPPPPSHDCIWSEGGSTGVAYHGVYVCSSGCDFFYELVDGEWVSTGSFCVT